MYKNIYYQRQKNLVHLWDSVQGYRSFPYTRYAYERTENGEYQSIYGDRLTKIYKFKKGDPDTFESDVPEATRVLIDLYSDSDEVSEGHTVLTYDIEVEMDSGLPDTKKAENTITSIALHDTISDHYWVLILDKKGILTYRELETSTIIPFGTEEDLLMKYLDIYSEINPSIVTGWNIDNFDTPYLYNRLKLLFGERQANRLSPIGECFYSPDRDRYFIAGVSYLDYISLYKNYNYGELPNYRLDTVGTIELGRGKIEYDGNLDQLFRDDVEKFIEYNLVDVEIVVGLDRKLQFIDLCRGICHVGHVPYEDFVFSSKYLEGALLTYLRRKGLVAPNKPKKVIMKTKRANIHEDKLYVDSIPDSVPNVGAVKIKKSETSSTSVHYSSVDRDRGIFILVEPLPESFQPGCDVLMEFIGAYVKDPIVGKYDWIYDLDLTSLYPSIIMTLNISPETKMGKIDNWDAHKFMKGEIDVFNIGNNHISMENLKKFLAESKYRIASNGVLYRSDKVGCIPDILDIWFNKRVEYRSLEKKYGHEGDSEKYAFYAKRQLVQKILLNSLYGVLGLPAFRFYDIDNAEAVTTTGRTVIQSTADMANIKYNLELNTPGKDYNIYIDTDSIFFSAVPLLDKRIPDWKHNEQEIIAGYVNDIAGEMQNYLNGFYNILSEKIFNVPKENHRFEIKKEFVAKSGLWVAKKRYAQWIISNNGVPVDKLDVKGLDVKRSSFPKAFQEIMSDVLISILKGKDEPEITQKIATFKKTMTEMDVVSIAKNSAIKNVTKWLPKGDRRLFHVLKGTPAHVKAAISYNDCLKHFKTPYRYEPMKDGDKIKWVYLRQNPLNIDGLGITGYNDPPEIVDFIKTYMDYDRIFEQELRGKLQNFYDSLGWGDVLSQQKQASKFFEF